MTVADDLRAAAGEIRRRGWTQGTAVLPAGQVCMLGGLAAACSDGSELAIIELVYGDRSWTPGYAAEYVKANQVLGEYIRGFTGSDRLETHYYNDNCVADGEEAAAVLEKAAAWVEEQVT